MHFLHLPFKMPSRILKEKMLVFTKTKKKSVMNIFKKILGLFAMFLWAFSGIAQDQNFSQFYELPLMRNPALGGIFDCNLRVKSVFRKQWQSVTVPYQTAAVSMEMKLPSNTGNWHNL